jgi:hypothetical protein
VLVDGSRRRERQEPAGVLCFTGQGVIGPLRAEGGMLCCSLPPCVRAGGGSRLGA